MYVRIRGVFQSNTSLRSNFMVAKPPRLGFGKDKTGLKTPSLSLYISCLYYTVAVCIDLVVYSKHQAHHHTGTPENVPLHVFFFCLFG